MPLVQIHEEAYRKVPDSMFLASLAAKIVEERTNPDVLCALIRVLTGRQVFGELFDVKAITNPLSFEFFQKQFDRAIATPSM
ncbi:hypothetical protein IKG31_02410 [Candidatus Saccharibacteria bacterium]|nr:hypothetical protein [Candidatus Saccharibacteria bacterium]